MNAKRRAVDPGRILKANGIEAYVEPIIRDEHTVHHQNLGGSCYVFLNRPADGPKAYEALRRTPEVEEIYEASEAARTSHLYPGRIGDLLLLAPKDTAFGELDEIREPVSVRSHGSRHEARVPLVAYGRKVDFAAYEYNLDLTRKLVLD
jgi:phosphonoacetate hydrolase